MKKNLLLTTLIIILFLNKPLLCMEKESEEKKTALTIEELMLIHNINQEFAPAITIKTLPLALTYICITEPTLYDIGIFEKNN